MNERQQRINGVIWGLHSEGKLSAKSLVDESFPNDAPLHNEFEWRDHIAGPLYREEQARNLIRSVRIDDVKREDAPRIFHAVVENGDHVYKTLAEISANKAWRDVVRERLKKNLTAAERDLRALNEAPALQREIRAFIRKDEDDNRPQP